MGARKCCHAAITGEQASGSQASGEQASGDQPCRRPYSFVRKVGGAAAPVFRGASCALPAASSYKQQATAARGSQLAAAAIQKRS